MHKLFKVMCLAIISMVIFPISLHAQSETTNQPSTWFFLMWVFLFLALVIFMIGYFKIRRLKQQHTHGYKLLDYVIEHNNAAVAIHDKDLNYVYVSKQYLKQYGVKDKDIIGKHHYEVFPDLPQKWRDVHQKVLEGNVFKQDRDPYPKEDGSVDWTRWEARPWYQSDGTIGGLIIYTEVINEQVKTEEVLKAQADAIFEQKQELKATLISIGDGVITTDKEGLITEFNPVSERITAWSKSEVMGKAFDDIFKIYDEKTHEALASPVQKVLKTQKAVELKNHTILVTKNDETRHIEDVASPIYDEQKQLQGVVLVFRDVSEKIRLEKTLNKEKQRLSRIINSTADIIFEIDNDKRFVSIYGNGLAKIEHKRKDILGKTVLQIFGQSGKERDQIYKEALKGHSGRYEWQYETSSGKVYFFESTISPMYDTDQSIIGAVGISRDITQSKQKQKEIEFLSFHDHLTNIHNRRYFAKQLSEKDHPSNYPLAIMNIDLNGLKILNDAYGHDVGDEALKKTALVLKESTQTSDIVARIGGDEFAIIRAKTNQKAMEELKALIQKKIDRLELYNVKLSVAIGFKIKQDENLSINAMIKAAEDNMYKQKLSVGISARNQTISAIMQTLTDKYEEEKVHSKQVAFYAKKLGQALRLNQDLLKDLEMAAMFHDIGKISIPDDILRKPGKLTAVEYDIVKKHTETGYQILRAADQYSDLAEHALYHHERIDGKGYPHGLKGDKIPLISRIIAVVDAYEAMTSHRPYKRTLNKEEAVKELKACSGTQFDEKLVDVFVNEVLN